MVYLETSALAKLYVTEAHSVGVAEIVVRNASSLYTSGTTWPEVLSLLARCVREKRIRPDEYRHAKRRFFADWDAFHVVEVTPACLAPAAELIERHGLRGFDAVHLCSALFIQTREFASFDVRLRAAAEAEGLLVIP